MRARKSLRLAFAIVHVCVLAGCAQKGRVSSEPDNVPPLSPVRLAALPGAEAEETGNPGGPPRPDHPREAERFRYMQRQGEDGAIPPGALLRAKAKRDAMAAAQGGIAVGGVTPTDWRWLGPQAVGGRVRGILIHPTSPNLMWAGGASGGIWRSTNGGQSWQPISDFIPNLAISCMAMSVNPADPGNPVLFAGTGEGFFNGDALPGAGIFRSTDGGLTWRHLPDTAITGNDPRQDPWGYVNRIAFCPNDYDLMLVASNSGIWRCANATDPNPANVTFDSITNERALDVDFDPNDGEIAIAGLDDRTVIQSTDFGQTFPTTSVLTVPLVSTALSAASVTDADNNPDNITVASTANLAVGDPLILDTGGNAEAVFIAAMPGGNVLTVNDLANNHAVGAPVRLTGRSATSTTAAVAAGATVIPVVSILGFFVGDTVHIDTQAGRETRQITAIGAASITVGAALGSPHPAGTSVRIGGRVEVDFSRSNPGAAYASSETTPVTGSVGSGLHRSPDSGATWTFRSHLIYNDAGAGGAPSRALGQIGWYANVVWVDPVGSNFVIVGGLNLVRYRNDLNTVTQISDWTRVPVPGDSAHADHHVIVHHPQFNNPDNIVYFGNDGGIYRVSNSDTVTPNAGWEARNNGLGVTQFYGGAYTAASDVFWGGSQDNSTHRYDFAAGLWSIVGWVAGANTFYTGDGGYCAADPADPHGLYGEFFNLSVFSSNADQGVTSADISQSNANPALHLGDAVNAATNFYGPVFLDPNRPSRLLAGGTNLWHSLNVNGAQANVAWANIFPNPGNGTNISAIATAPNLLQAGNTSSEVLFVGYNNGDIYRSANFADPPGGHGLAQADVAAMPNRFVTSMAIDPDDPDLVFAAFSGYKAGGGGQDNENIWRTTDGGATWTQIGGAGLTGLPNIPIQSVIFHPTKAGWLYVGTDIGVFATENSGEANGNNVRWTVADLDPDGNGPQGEGPANVEVAHVLFKDNRTLLAVTHGRGLWQADAGAPSDIGPPTARVSLDSNEIEGNDDSHSPAITRNGRYVAFRSSASDLVPNDTNNRDDVFVRDRQAGTTERVSLSSTAAQANGTSYSGNNRSISATGRYVVFASEATTLVPNDTNAQTDVFLRDRQLGTTEIVSVSTAGVQGNANSGGFGAAQCSVSEDGRFVVFESHATNLVPDDTNGYRDIFVRDRWLGQTFRANLSTAGAQANFDSRSATISSDGSTVVFLSGATNLIDNDTNNKTDAFARLLPPYNPFTFRVSLTDAIGETNGDTFGVDVSKTGRYYVFDTDAANVVPDDTNGQPDVFLYDSVNYTVQRVNVGPQAAEANAFTISQSVSDDGRFIAFASDADNLVLDDNNALRDVFVRDRQLKYTVRVNLDAAGIEANGASGDPRLSGDGRTVAYTSDADNLVVNDFNFSADVFAADRGTCYEQACDMNCDGTINAFDIQPFVDALSPSPPTACNDCAIGDMNGDGSVNVNDIQPFVDCLNSAG